MGEHAAGPTRITVRVKPRSARPRVGGRHEHGELVVAVREPAVDGRATAAAAKALARSFGLAASRVELVSGATSRTKVFALEGDPTVLGLRLEELLRT